MEERAPPSLRRNKINKSRGSYFNDSQKQEVKQAILKLIHSQENLRNIKPIQGCINHLLVKYGIMRRDKDKVTAKYALDLVKSDKVLHRLYLWKKAQSKKAFTQKNLIQQNKAPVVMPLTILQSYAWIIRLLFHCISKLERLICEHLSHNPVCIPRSSRISSLHNCQQENVSATPQNSPHQIIEVESPIQENQIIFLQQLKSVILLFSAPHLTQIHIIFSLRSQR